MKFGWINLIGAVFVILILIPNVIYAIKTKGRKRPETKLPRAVYILEQIGRYACLVLMWLPLLVWKFGFGSGEALAVYLIANTAMVIADYVFWIIYAKKQTRPVAMALAILPTAIFLLSGILLRHPLLIAAAVIFGAAHCLITHKTH